MRIQFWVLSALMGCLALLIGLVPGRTQNPGAPPAGREGKARTRLSHGPAPGPAAPTAGARTPVAPSAPGAWADERFRRLDRNGDGHLSFDEMTENLKVEKDKWDANGDGLIGLDEWREYVRAFAAQQRSSATDQVSPARYSGRKPRSQDLGREPRVQPVSEPRVPPAVRPPFTERSPKKGARPVASSLPRNIPAWFKEYDANGDGLIDLEEWKAKEDSVREFRKYDVDGDGFISVVDLVRSGQFLTGMNPPPVLVGTDPEIGQYYYWKVTGTAKGNVWGTDIYTIDSPMGTVAVHAGVLRKGQTAFVKVILLPGQQHYDGSFSNGVMTNDRHTGYHKSFRVEAIREASAGVSL